MLAYFHGKNGFRDFQKIERIGIPINILGSVIFLVVMFSSKDLGAVTKTIKFEREDGKIGQRVIPKPEFIKELTMFFFKNESDDISIDWMHHGFIEGIDFALSQDLFISAVSPIGDLRGRGLLIDLRQGGFKDGRGAPFALCKKYQKIVMSIHS